VAILVACGAWLAGLGGALWLVPPAETVQGPSGGWLALALLALLAAGLARPYPLRLIGLWVSVLLLGWGRGLAVLPESAANPLQPYYGPAALRGVVAAPARPSETWVSLHLRVEAVEQAGAWVPASGVVLLRLPRTAPYDYGAALEVRGTLTPPPETRSGYGAALWRQGVRGAMGYPAVAAWAGAAPPSLAHTLYGWRRQLEHTIGAVLPEPHAALLTGVLLGGSAGLPSDFQDALRAGGLTHIVAVSGFNVTLVAGVAGAVAERWAGRRVGWLLALAAVGLYTLLVGAPPSALRAAGMAAIALGATALGRPRDGLVGLALAAALLAAWNPWLLGDLGFQLSVLATAGLIWLQPALQARLAWLPAWASEGLAATLAAQALVLPIQLAAFHTVSLVAPLVNLLVVPLIPPAMLLGVAVCLGGAVAPGLAPLVAVVPWGYLELIVRVVRAAAALPGTHVEVGMLPPALAGVYAAAIVMLVLGLSPEAAAWRQRLRAGIARWWPGVATAAGLAGLLLALLALAGRPDGRLQVAVLDVGQGDATLIRTPGGRLVLVDGGPSPARLLAHLGERLGLLERHFDLVVLTHPHEDHLAGLVEVVERYSVGRVLEGAVDYTSGGVERWRAALAAREVPVTTGASGQQWQLDTAVLLEVWAVPPLPGSRADLVEPPGALVLRLHYGATSLLLPGDLVAEQGHRLLAAGADLRSAVLLVPHHGSRTGLDAALLEAIAPAVAVVSSGERNRFGHPAPQTLQLLAAHGVPVWRTDRDGTVELTSDGEGWSVRAVGKGRP